MYELNNERDIYVNPSDLFNPIGILDPEGNKLNPLNYKLYSDRYLEMSIGEQGWSKLPMYRIREETIQKIYDNQVILIISGTGSGKTVLTPKYALHALNYEGKIAITNPKTIPTQSNADYHRKQLDVKLGDEVGVKYKGSDPYHYSYKSKLVYCTDGHIVAKLKSDPMLFDYDCVIIDEAHERNVRIDLLLLLLKDLVLKRSDFKLIIMSATVNEQLFIDYFPKDKFIFDMVNAPGKPNFPIDVFYLDKPINELKNDNFDNKQINNIVNKTVEKVLELLLNTLDGDILVFFHGKPQCVKGCKELNNKINKIDKLKNKIFCSGMHRGIDKETEEYITDATKYKNHPNGPFERKVVFSTNIAESSITIKGIDIVIDTGLANISEYIYDKGMNTLLPKYISKASHKQRRGRTGRTRPGKCYNMFTEKEYEKNFLDYSISPIMIEDITSDILSFIARSDLVTHIDFPFKYTKELNFNNPSSLNNFMNKLIETPKLKNIKIVIQKLYVLGCINVNNNKGYINDLGRALSEFNMKPEIGRLIISGYNYRCSREMYILTSFLESIKSLEDIFVYNSKLSINDKNKFTKKIYNKYYSSYGDHFVILNIYYEFCKRRYVEYDKDNKEELKEIIKKTEKWCDNNNLKYKLLNSIKKEARDKRSKLLSIINSDSDDYDIKKKQLFINEKPDITSNYEINIVKALSKGLFINLIKKEYNQYTNCYHSNKSKGDISNRSIYNSKNNNSKYLFYTNLSSISGNVSYDIVTPIPQIIIDDMNKNPFEKQLLDYCLNNSNKSKKYSKKSKNIKPKKYSKKSKNFKSKKYSKKFKNIKSKNFKSKKYSKKSKNIKSKKYSKRKIPK